MDDDVAALKRYLDMQREHVLGAVAGLSDDQLRRRVLPSGWHCLGMIKHLALSDEHYWFRCVMGGEPLDYFPPGPNADWQLGEGESAADVLDLYREEIARADAVIAERHLDTPPLQRDPRWETWGRDFPDLRDVLLHVTTETAVHAGHLDAVRELLDGRLWVVL
jgi:hypothetical protein